MPRVLQEVPLGHKSLADYTHIVGRELVADIRERAKDLEGCDIDQVETGYVARVWQHEFDHLNGTLITDRMGAVAKMTARKLLRELEDKYVAEQKKGPEKPDRKRM